MVYLDCNATTPIDSKVKDLVIHYLTEEYGNSGSRTHEFGQRAQQAVEKARRQIASVVKANSTEVVFTSGATESNNIAILGLEKKGTENNKRHIISTSIEHKAVLEPLQELEKRGFEIDLIKPDKTGRILADEVKKRLRENTLLVSIMHVNNETGVIQPISEISSVLKDHSAYFHVDGAQGFGKDIPTLQNNRIDLISISGHKIYAPKGVGALIIRRRGYNRIPLQPLMFGGGQEKGLRPGTLPVHLIAGLGLAAEIAIQNYIQRNELCLQFRQNLLDSLLSLNPKINGDLQNYLPNVINLSFNGIDSEALMLALKDEVAISNGSACTSHSYQPSHVLEAMKLSQSTIESAIRISWCHFSQHPNWNNIRDIIQSLI